MEEEHSSNIPWIIKYRPKSLKDVIGNREAISKIKSWLSKWERGIPKKKALLLYGPPGVGKTVTVEALANDLNFELMESNASDDRRESDIKGLIGIASQYSTLLGKKRMILLDEIDGISGTADRGGLNAIIKIMRESRCPILLTANNAFDPRFSQLRRECDLVEFKKPTRAEIVSLLKRICRSEGIEADPEALKLIAEKSERDVRSAINDLQAIAQGLDRLTVDDVVWLGYRDRKEEIFKVLKLIFYSRDCLSAIKATNLAQVDLDMLFEWIYENVPYHLTSPYELSEAMEALSLADLFRGRISKTQRWSLLRYYIDLMTAGIALSRVGGRGKWAPFKFPQRIMMMSRSKKDRAIVSEIGRKIGRKCHVSSKKAIVEILPYIKIIFENDREMAEKISRWLNLDDSMRKYIISNF